MHQLVDNETFLKRLTELFGSSEEHGSIWITHKRLTYDDGDVTMKQTEGETDTREYPCLLRVSDGDKAKISTKVDPGQLPKFYAVYGALLKSAMTTLRKRDKKREKIRAELAAKRKKRMSDPVIVQGPKRGNGRRKRQRAVKAAIKQQASQAKAKKREEERLKKEALHDTE